MEKRRVKELESDLHTFTLLQEYQALRKEKDKRRGALDCVSMCEKILKDESGKQIVFHAIHRSWHNHAAYCWERNIHPLILAPWGHGKTVGMVVGGCLYDLGENPSHRIKIVCNSDENAKARVKSVSRYIEHDEDFKKLYPNCVPDKNNEAWTSHEIFVRRERRVRSIDPSLQAKGIFSTGIGGRADLLIFDDPVDRRNSIDFPEMRRRLPEVYFDTWMSRLEPGGRIVYIATIWHIEDLTHLLMGESGYCTLKQSVSDDFTHIKTELINFPDDEHPLFEAYERKKDPRTASTYVVLPLWKEKWSKEELIKRCGTTPTSQRSFERGFRQKPFTSTELMFPSVENCIKYGIHVKDIYTGTKDWGTFVGVDLSGKKRPGNVLFTLGYNWRTGKKVPLDIRYGKWTSPEVARQLSLVNRDYEPIMIVVENNGIQESIIQWIQMYGSEYIYWDRVVPYTTLGEIKRSEVGLPSLEVEFSNHSWDIYYESKHGLECRCGQCLWIEEMRTYPFGKSEDAIMANWFAREGCRKYLLDGQIIDEWNEPKDLGIDVGEFGIFNDDLMG